MVLDGAHNLDGVSKTVEELRARVHQRGGALHIVWGAVSDKDPLQSWPCFLRRRHWWCAADIPRAMAPNLVARVRSELQGEVMDAPLEALDGALAHGAKEDVFWVGGSLFVVGDEAA